jgi:hypothetical protein
MSLLGRKGSRSRRIGVAALSAVVALAAGAAGAQAKVLKLNFTDGRINLGDQKGLHMIDPAVPDPPATLFAPYNTTTGAFTAPPAGVNIPTKTFENLDTGVIPVDAVATFAGLGQVVGNYNSATGVLNTQTLNVTAKISIYPAGQGGDETALISRCRISPVPLPLDSSGQIVDDSDPGSPINYDAAPFDPPGGAGVATWADLPASVFEAGATNLCSNVDDLVGGPGGIWLAGTAAIIDDPALGITVAPKRKGTRPGKKATFNARVANSGQAPANGVQICVKAPKKLKGPRCQSVGTLNGGASATRAFKLKPKRSAAGKRFTLTFTASADNAGSKSTTAKLRVRRPG